MAAVDPDKQRRRTRALTLGGLLTALILVFLALSAWSPTADLAFFSLASLIVAIAVIEIDLRGGLIVCLAAGLIGLAWPGAGFTWPFLLFFGPYPLLRAIIDSRHARAKARWLRLTAGFCLLLPGSAIFLLTVGPELASRLGNWRWALIPGSAAILFLYDTALGLLIAGYSRHLRR